MPELPEAETIKNDLKNEILGEEIKELKTFDGYETSPSNEYFKHNLLNSKIKDAGRLGKRLYLRFKNKYLLIHLAVTGKLFLTKDLQKKEYLRFALKLSNGNYLNFFDKNQYGKAEVVDEGTFLERKSKLGPSPLAKSLTTEKLEKKLKAKDTGIKRALLNQSLISGVGNIYANDSLFLAKLHPEARTRNLSTKDYEKLLKALRSVLKEGIKKRGSSFDSYVDLYGKKGSYQNHFKVYLKDGKPCPNCDRTVRRIEIGGRRTYFCPECQNLSKSRPQMTLKI